MSNKNNIKLIAFVFWLILLISFFVFKEQKDLSFFQMTSSIFHFLSSSMWSGIILIMICVFRPILFFPATLLTLLSGILFGFWWGLFFIFIGENISASFAYIVGKYFGADILNKKGKEFSLLKKTLNKVQDNHFESVLIMRFIFLPFDLVNYGCGIMKIKWKSFFWATFIGIIPGAAAFVSLGASLENIDQLELSKISLNNEQLAITVVLFITSFALARFLKKFKK